MTKGEALGLYLVSTMAWVLCSVGLHQLLGPGVSEEMAYFLAWCIVAALVFTLPRPADK